MKLSHKIRYFWHDLFFKNAPKERFEYALKCQDVTAGIDLHQRPNSVSGHFRFMLHMSLCQACKNYYDLSKAFSKAIKQKPQAPPIDVNQINQSLLKKFGTKSDGKTSR